MFIFKYPRIYPQIPGVANINIQKNIYLKKKHSYLECKYEWSLHHCKQSWSGNFVCSGVSTKCGTATAYVSFEDLAALLRVVQRRDGQVGDGDVSRGGQRDQQHQVAPGLLQRQLQVMRVLLSEGGEIQLAAARQ